ncbi:MAG: GTP-binding protein [Planctomycetota bacterium]|jgi:small GTP-binding protein
MSTDQTPPNGDSMFTPHEVVLEQAKLSLDDVMATIPLEDRDRKVFAGELEAITGMMEKLERGVIHIAAFGMVSRGKSALLNALLGREAFEIGATHGTTKEKTQARWDPTDAAANTGVHTVREASDLGPIIELIDTPGINEVEGQTRAQLAHDVARRADLLLFVVSGDMLRPELEALTVLRDAKKPIIVVFNMIDLYPEADRDTIYHKIRDERVRELVKPEDVVLAAGKPRDVPVMVKDADGTMTKTWETPEPIIADLKLKILECLEREGQALAALNTMLFVNDLHEQIVERRLALRDEEADSLIWKFTMTKAMAVALNPIAVADVAGGIGTDIAMVFALSRLYGIPMSRVGIGKLVVEIGKMAGLFTATEVGTHMIIGMAKSFFAASTLFTGGSSIAAYAAVAPVQALAAGYSSRVIGEAIKVYLRNGASWGPAGPKTVITSILESLDRDSIMRRIKDELRSRLERSGG